MEQGGGGGGERHMLLFELFCILGVTELRSYFSLFSPAMTLRMSESPVHGATSGS